LRASFSQPILRHSVARTRSSLAYLKPYRGALVGGVLMLVLTNLCFLGIPEFQARAVQALKDHEYSQVPDLVALLIVFAIATALTRIASRVWIFTAARAAEYDLRSELFGHMMTMSPGYFRDHPTGDVMSRLTNDVQTVRGMWGAGMVHLANAVTAFATVLTYMVKLDYRVAFAALIPFPLIFVLGN